nr:transposase, mutator type [Tanacetum cinerariifolium]
MVAPLYNIRDNDVHDRDPYKMYIKKYNNGNITFVDLIDSGQFYVHEIDSMLEDLGQDGHKVMFYHFLKPGFDLDNGLEPLACDKDVVAWITPVAKKLVLDVNNKQTSGKDFVGQSSEKDLEGQSSGKDLERQSSAVGNDGSSQGSNTGENVDLVDTTNNVEIEGDEERHGEEERQRGEETEVKDESDSEDSDYLVDKDNNVDDVDVDMEDFEYNIDEEVEFVGCRDREHELDIEEGDAEEIEVLDNDYFKSASDSDDEANRLWKINLKQIRRQAHASEQIYKTYFYVGKEFPNKEAVKAYIKEHSIETRREIRLEKNDNERVRAI